MIELLLHPKSSERGYVCLHNYRLMPRKWHVSSGSSFVFLQISCWASEVLRSESEEHQKKKKRFAPLHLSHALVCVDVLSGGLHSALWMAQRGGAHEQMSGINFRSSGKTVYNHNEAH